MFKPGLCPIAWTPRRVKELPAQGQDLLIRVRKTVELWQGRRRERFCEGEWFVCSVVTVGDDGLLDLHTARGQTLRLHIRDVAFSFEPYER